MKKIMMALPLIILMAAFQIKETITITGNVKDENGAPVVASIIGGKAGTTADANGNYSITVGKNQKYLVFSAGGYI